MLKFTFHTDLGHGWLQVPTALMEALEVHPSSFSYTDGKNSFLEEDCDASLFIDAAKKAGLKYEIVSHHVEGDSPIRNLPRIKDPKYVNPFRD